MNNYTDIPVNEEYVMKYGDPRLRSLPLMESPAKSVYLSLCYLAFVKVVGPMYMQNRKPFELRKWMMVYNASMVALSSWMFYNFAKLWFFKYSWRCEPISYSSEGDGMLALMTCYVFFLSKFVEFFDTIFFVLRKKYSQTTFLHLFHHGFVPITSWYGVTYGGGGYAIILPMVNVFVHIWMYLYYGLSACGPAIQKYLWWKKYLTTLQLIQFVIVMISTTNYIFFPTENCKASGFIIFLMLGQAIIFFGLFMHFYFATYMKKKSTKSVKNGNYKNGVEHRNGNHIMTTKTE